MIISQSVIRKFNDALSDYDSTVTISKPLQNEAKEIVEFSTKSTMLCHLEQGSFCMINGLEMLKLESFKNGTTLVLVNTKLLRRYGETSNYLESIVRKSLHKTVYDEISNVIGDVYIKPHITVFGSPYIWENSHMYLNDEAAKEFVREKIGLLSFSDYCKYKDIILNAEYKRFHLANSASGENGDGVCYVFEDDVQFVKPGTLGNIYAVLAIDSSRIVKTRILSTYSIKK